MQTITKTFNIYNFDELSAEIQEELIKKEAEGIRQVEIDEFLEEEMDNLAELLLEEHFGENAIFKKAYYSLCYCQGDGAMIEFDLKYCGKDVEIRHNDGHYYHERSFEIISTDKELTELQHKTLKEKIVKINEQLTKYGYQYIEEDRTEQAIEQLKDCMFYENGDIY